jgi:hypothetical protein
MGKPFTAAEAAAILAEAQTTVHPTWHGVGPNLFSALATIFDRDGLWPEEESCDTSDLTTKTRRS